jgi:ubiquinone/menaquinone biosynthesis C-methylase UbiE
LTTITLIACLFTALIGAVFIVWRFASNRRAIPCPSWLAWLVELDNPFFRSTRAAVIIEHLNVEPGMRVLDAGCGPGRVAIPLARKVGPTGRVVAVDVQPAMLEKSKAKAKREMLTNIDFLQAALGDGPLNLGTFDRATLVTVLGEIPNRHAALQEIFDALRSGGILAITELIADPHFQTQPSVRGLTEAVGFRERNLVGGRFAYTMYLERPA